MTQNFKVICDCVIFRLKFFTALALVSFCYQFLDLFLKSVKRNNSTEALSIKKQQRNNITFCYESINPNNHIGIIITPFQACDSFDCIKQICRAIHINYCTIAKQQ